MKDQIEKSFKTFDKDQNSVLDRLELKQFLIAFFDKYKMHVPINEEFVDETFRNIDKNNDGKIQLEEFYPFFEKFLEKLVHLFEFALEEHPDRIISINFYTEEQLDQTLRDLYVF